MAGDRRKPSFPVPDWVTCHKRSGWYPDKMMRSDPSTVYAQLTALAPSSTNLHSIKTRYAGYSTSLRLSLIRDRAVIFFPRPLVGFLGLCCCMFQNQNDNSHAYITTVSSIFLFVDQCRRRRIPRPRLRKDLPFLGEIEEWSDHSFHSSAYYKAIH